MDERIARQVLIPDWDQNALAKATVIIIGMGALGNEVARLLALAGVGRMVFCDHDTIESSNLSRMALFHPHDVGRLKVDVAAERLRTISPGIQIETRPERLIYGVGLAELRDAQLVVSCLDSHSARLQLTRRCQLVSAAYLDGGTQPWGGEVRPYLQRDPAAPCFGCSLTIHERAIVDDPWSCLDVIQSDPMAAAIPSSALVGVWMGTFAVRYLMGLSIQQDSLIIDIPRSRMNVLQQVRDPSCMLHETLDEPELLPVSNRSTVAELLAALPSGAVPRLWSQVQDRQRCTTCGFEREVWLKIPETATCPRCSGQMYPRRTPEISDAPALMPLADLGVAPREILSVYVNDDDLRLFELKG